MKTTINLKRLSLPAKLTVGFILVGAATIVLTAATMLILSRNNMRSQIRDGLQDYARLAAAQIDGDTFDTLRDPQAMQGEAYKTMKAKMGAIVKQSPKVADVYGMRQLPEGKIIFVVDPSPDDPPNLGDEYSNPGPALAANFARAQDAFTENDFYTDQWGTWLSGYAPIRKTDGAIVGVLGVDYSAQGVRTQEDSALRTLVGVVLLSMILMGLATFFLARFFLAPLPYLTRIAGLVAEGKLPDQADIQQKMVQFQKRQDEIGAFARQFNHLTGYFAEMAAFAQRIAEGDLTVHVAAKSAEDLLGNALARMSEALRQIIGQVAENAASVSAASAQLNAVAGQTSEATHQIAATMQQVAQGTTQQTESVTKTAYSVEGLKKAIDGVAAGSQDQASSVAQLTTVMGQLSEAVNGIRQGAAAQAQGMAQATAARQCLASALQQVGSATEQVTAEAQQAAQSAGEGTTLVAQTVEGIQHVRAATEQLAERVGGLGQQSAQIGSIIETIGDIASQTNLLALNAAIEAARAGQHGKGFAVVADEVRKLAERSAAATKEIGKMIRAIQSGANEAVQAMGQAGANVSAAVRLTDQAGAAFRDIAAKSLGSANRLASVQAAVEAMRRANAQLDQAVTEAVALAEQNQQTAQSMGLLNNQIVESLDVVSAVVEENTAAAEEMAAESSEVAQAIESIASVSEENSAAVEEVSASSEEMSAQVEEVTTAAQALASMAAGLEEVVAQFTLGAQFTQSDLDRPKGQVQPALAAPTALQHKSNAAGRRPEMALPSGNGHRRADGSRRVGSKPGAAA